MRVAKHHPQNNTGHHNECQLVAYTSNLLQLSNTNKTTPDTTTNVNPPVAAKQHQQNNTGHHNECQLFVYTCNLLLILLLVALRHRPAAHVVQLVGTDVDVASFEAICDGLSTSLCGKALEHPQPEGGDC